MMNNTTTTRPMTDRQRSFIESLLQERTADHPENVRAWRDQLNAWHREGRLTTAMASTAIDAIKQLRPTRKPIAEDAAQPEVGVYVLEDGTIVKAQPNKTKTNVYTSRWVEITGERLVDATEEHVHGEWVYAPELKARLDEARKMTLDEAKDFILRYGRCVRCSRRLKAADSVERGIGPVCVRYFTLAA